MASKGDRYRVLIVDDEPLVGRSLQRCLERQHDVTVLTSGTDALRRLQRSELWDVVLCDFAMPGVDGIALYEEVLAKSPALAQHWAFITGGALADRTARFLARHEVLTLNKPVDPFMVLEVVDRLGRGKGSEHHA